MIFFYLILCGYFYILLFVYLHIFVKLLSNGTHVFKFKPDEVFMRRNIVIFFNKNTFKQLTIIHLEQSEVAGHFSADDHSVDDMSISGVMYCRDIKTRKLKEQKLISKLGCVLGRGIYYH